MWRALIFFSVLFVGCLPRFRRVAYTNLRIAFGPAGTGLYVRSLFRLADNVCAILKSCRKNPARRPKIRFDDSKFSLIPAPHPWVLVTGHIGPFELQGEWSRVLNIPIRVVVRPPKNLVFRSLYAFIRRRLGVNFIDKKNVVRETIQAMSAGSSVVIVADHNAGHQGTFLPFLGFPASTSRLPAVLALRFQKPVVMGFIRKEGGEFVAWVERVIVPDALAEPKEEERRILSEMNAVFTDVIRRYPEEWFWFHRRWKTRPGDREAHILR